MRNALPTLEGLPAAEWRQVAVQYPFSRWTTVGPVDLAVRPGERVLLLGASGSGKSTLLLTLTGLIPQSIPAAVSGYVSVFGTDVSSRPPWEWASQVAHYFQDADQTLCGMRVEDEIAFPLENLRVPPIRIAQTVTTVMRDVGLADSWRRRRTSTMSGGERQLVALGATLAQDPRLLAVDEPTAHLSPVTSRRFHTLLRSNRPERAVLIVDHKLDDLVEWIDRVAVLGDEGRVVTTGRPRSVFRDFGAQLASLGIWRPAVSVLDAALGQVGVASPVPPLTIGESLAHLEPGAATAEMIRKARPVVQAFVGACHASSAAPASGARVITTLSNADCAPWLGPTVLRGIDLEIREGEILGVLGANGTGKSTLGACLAGHLRLKAGTRQGPPGGIAFQRSENQFTAGTVREEIETALPRTLTKPETERRTEGALARWGLAGLERQHPLALSQGEQRRLALASLTASNRWPLLILDEPMAGLDARNGANLIQHVEELSHRGRAIALITHDMGLALRLCPRSIILGEGRILAQGPTHELLSDSEILDRAGLEEPSSAEASRWLRRASSC